MTKIPDGQFKNYHEMYRDQNEKLINAANALVAQVRNFQYPPATFSSPDALEAYQCEQLENAKRSAKAAMAALDELTKGY